MSPQGVLHVYPVWAVMLLLAKGWEPVSVSATAYGQTAVCFPLESKPDLDLARRCMDQAIALRNRGVRHGHTTAR